MKEQAHKILNVMLNKEARQTMFRIYHGKRYIAIRIGNLCFGFGHPDSDLTFLADLRRKHRGF